MKTFSLSKRTKKSGITKCRENIDELFSTTIYSKDLIRDIYNCVFKMTEDHEKAKDEVRGLFNRINQKNA